MKRLAIGLVLGVLSLALTMSPARAAGSPQDAPALSVADQAFLAALAMSGASVSGTRARNPIQGKSVCFRHGDLWKLPAHQLQQQRLWRSLQWDGSELLARCARSVTCNGVTTQWSERLHELPHVRAAVRGRLRLLPADRPVRSSQVYLQAHQRPLHLARSADSLPVGRGFVPARQGPAPPSRPPSPHPLC